MNLTNNARRPLLALVLVASTLSAVACTPGSPQAGSPPSVPAAVTTPVLAVPVDIEIGAAGPLDLDLPGVDVDVNVGVDDECTLTVVAENEVFGFAKNSSELPPVGEGRRALNEVLDLFASATVVQVAGHASTEGNPTRNDVLANDRATAVAAAGRALLPEVDFVPQGYGSTSTIVVEDGTEATQSKNRRVELSGSIATCSS